MKNAAIALLLLTLACSSSAPPPETETSLRQLSRNRLAQLDGEIALPGLEQPVEVLRDTWGVAHIYAKTKRDLFFAQGFAAAQDRLYQIEIWRRTGAGQLAEVFGPEYVERDRIARLVGYRGDMDAEWSSYGPDAREIAEAFTSGINAYVDANRDRLPVEFELLGFEPGRWRPEDVTLRIAGLLMVRNIAQETARSEMVAKLGLETTRRFYPTDPVIDFAPDPDLDLNGIDERVTAGYRDAVSIPRLEGSNNWVVSGRLSSTGKPLLASDPHRPVILPSLRYLVHLNGPEFNVIGSGEPALPGVAIGHNERVGWGFTIVQYDAADLFVEQLDPDNPTRYRYGDEWLEMEVEHDQVGVKGQKEPAAVELKFTRHGPVIWEDAANHRAVALRWAGQEPGTAGYLGSVAMDRVQNWDGFVDAMRRWKVPSENIVYADVDGDIGWIPAGLVPIRKNWKGLFPAPGWKTDYRWDGFRGVDDLPRIHNPKQGYIATANHKILPDGYPYDLSFDWSAPYRFQRIDGVLSASRDFTVADFEKLQQDETSLPARQIIGLLKALPESPDAVDARALLSDWDFVVDRDSGAAALYEIWMPKLLEKYVHSQVPPAAQQLVAENLELPVMIRGLSEISEAERRFVMLESLQDAAAEARERLGESMDSWRWGDLHSITFEHPLADTPARAAVFNRGPIERGGDAYTPNATGGRDFKQSSGASYRHILDLSDWDRSVFTSTPGQSGQPESPFYDDLAPQWGVGEYSPLLFTREAVEANTSHRLTLKPAQ